MSNTNLINYKKKVMLLHNIIAPYRLPIFEELNKYSDLFVYFCKIRTKDRKWDTSLKEYTFHSILLKGFDFLAFTFNYTLLFDLILNKYDCYIITENRENFASIFSILLMSKIYQKPFVIWSGVIDFEKPFKKILKKKARHKLIYNLYFKIENIYRKFLYSQADSFITYGARAKSYLLKLGVQESKIFAGTQIMPSKLLPIISKSNIDTQEMSKHKNTILYLGYLRKEKGVKYLIQAFKSIKSTDSLLIIAGTGSEENELKKLSVGMENIIYTGYADSKKRAELFKAADIFILPTLYDSWGLVINESLYYNVPIITTDAAAGSELLDHGKHGFIIRSANVEDLKNYLQEFLKNKKLREEMKKNVSAYKKYKLSNPKYAVANFKKAISLALN